MPEFAQPSMHADVRARSAASWPVGRHALGLAALGLAVFGALALLGGSAAVQAQAARDSQSLLSERIARLETAMGRQARPLADARFLSAALLLQSSASGSRPWMREYEAFAALAPDGALPKPLREVLVSHAGRGIASTAELSDRFAQLAPRLVERAPDDRGIAPRAAGYARQAFAAIGLASPPAPTETELVVGRILEQLRRADLIAAVADARSLDDSLQPLLAGWLAAAEARLAVEHAIRETMLRALGASEPTS